MEEQAAASAAVRDFLKESSAELRELVQVIVHEALEQRRENMRSGTYDKPKLPLPSPFTGASEDVTPFFGELY